MSNRLSAMKKYAAIEAKMLKKTATKKELLNLDIRIIDPNNPCQCIYGLMTGNCDSERAKTLIFKCAPRVYSIGEDGSYVPDTAKLNGKPYELEGGKVRSWEFQTPIEMLIYDANGGKEAQRNLIAYLKGETRKLKL